MAKTEQQTEIDGLREEVRRLRNAFEASENEVAALRSGQAEARAIAESAEVLAAERDALKRDVVALAAHAADLATVVHCYESNAAPPYDVMKRVNAKRYGTPLQNGVPPHVVKG
jgi:hypothetical protein